MNNPLQVNFENLIFLLKKKSVTSSKFLHFLKMQNRFRRLGLLNTVTAEG